MTNKPISQISSSWVCHERKKESDVHRSFVERMEGSRPSSLGEERRGGRDKKNMLLKSR